MRTKGKITIWWDLLQLAEVQHLQLKQKKVAMEVKVSKTAHSEIAVYKGEQNTASCKTVRNDCFLSSTKGKSCLHIVWLRIWTCYCCVVRIYFIMNVHISLSFYTLRSLHPLSCKSYRTSVWSTTIWLREEAVRGGKQLQQLFSPPSRLYWAASKQLTTRSDLNLNTHIHTHSFFLSDPLSVSDSDASQTRSKFSTV